MISIVFISNFFNHHERFFCDELHSNPDVRFTFIQTEEMNDERKKLGWSTDISAYPYVICSYGSHGEYEKTLKICSDADVLILGSAPYIFVSSRVKNNKLTFYYAERLFRNGLWHMLNPKTFLKVLKRFVIPGQKSNFYLLAASAYTAFDTVRIFAFNNRRFKWGHFIDVSCSIKQPGETKNKKVRLLWAGRFLPLKHPDYAVRVASALADRKIDFHLDIIGSGSEEYN